MCRVCRTKTKKNTNDVQVYGMDQIDSQGHGKSVIHRRSCLRHTGQVSGDYVNINKSTWASFGKQNLFPTENITIKPGEKPRYIGKV